MCCVCLWFVFLLTVSSLRADNILRPLRKCLASPCRMNKVLKRMAPKGKNSASPILLVTCICGSLKIFDEFILTECYINTEDFLFSIFLVVLATYLKTSQNYVFILSVARWLLLCDFCDLIHYVWGSSAFKEFIIFLLCLIHHFPNLFHHGRC